MKKDICKEDDVHAILEKAINEEFNETMQEHKLSMMDTEEQETLNYETSYSFAPVNTVPPSFIENLENQTVSSDSGTKSKFAMVFLAIFVLVACLIPVGLVASGKMMVAPQTNRLATLFSASKMQSFVGKDIIPVLLDAKDNSLAPMLSKCLRLKGKNDFDQVEGEDVDFYVVNSLCDVPKSIRWNKKFRVFFLMQNPLEESYSKKKETKNNIDSASEQDATTTTLNPLTRSIVCKQEGTLTERDFTKARRFLKEKADVELAAYYPQGIKMFEEKYNWLGRSKNSDNCFKAAIKSTSSMNRLNVLNNEVISKFEESYKANNYDVKLYMDYVGNKVNN